MPSCRSAREQRRSGKENAEGTSWNVAPREHREGAPRVRSQIKMMQFVEGAEAVLREAQAAKEAGEESFGGEPINEAVDNAQGRVGAAQKRLEDAEASIQDAEVRGSAAWRRRPGAFVRVPTSICEAPRCSHRMPAHAGLIRAGGDEGGKRGRAAGAAARGEADRGALRRPVGYAGGGGSRGAQPQGGQPT